MMKELREARKVNKQGKHLEAEKIKAELEAKMGEQHSRHNPVQGRYTLSD